MRRYVLLFVAAAALAVIWWSSCETPSEPEARTPVPGIVLLCMDTLRFDAPSSTGAEGERLMPRRRRGRLLPSRRF